MNVVALLTARGGSKLRKKSFIEISSKPCIQYIIDQSIKSSLINNYYCSSDDNDILNYSEKQGFNPIKRPQKLSSDEALHIDVIQHAISVIQNISKKEIDILIVLLGNAPIVYKEWISESIRFIKLNPEFTSVIPVYEDSDHSPFRSKVINHNNGLLETPEFIKNFKNIPSNRQMLPKSYFLCHNFWTLNVKKWTKTVKLMGDGPWSFMGERIKPLIVPKSHDIHINDDIIICEKIIKWYDKNSSFKNIKLT